MRRSDRGPAPGPVVVSLRSRRCSCRAGTVSSRPASTSTSRAAIRYGRSCRSVRMWVSTGGPVEIVPAAACRHRHTDGERRAALRASRPYRPGHGRRGSRGPPRWPGAIDWRRRATTSSPSMRAPRRLPEGVRYRYRTVDSGARGRMALGIGGITVGSIGAREMDLTFDGPLSGCDGSSSGLGSPAVTAPGIEDAMENVPDAVEAIAELRQAEKPSTQARGRHETRHDGGGRRRAVEVPHRRGRDDGLPAGARADEHLGLRAGSRRLEGRADHHRRQAREGHGRRCGPRGGVAYSEQVPVHLLDSALERSSPAQ